MKKKEYYTADIYLTKEVAKKIEELKRRLKISSTSLLIRLAIYKMYEEENKINKEEK